MSCSDPDVRPKPEPPRAEAVLHLQPDRRVRQRDLQQERSRHHQHLLLGGAGTGEEGATRGPGTLTRP